MPCPHLKDWQSRHVRQGPGGHPTMRYEDKHSLKRLLHVRSKICIEAIETYSCFKQGSAEIIMLECFMKILYL